MSAYLFKNASVVNEGKVIVADVFVKDDLIRRIAPNISNLNLQYKEINCEGKFLIPGVIDDQVHFREPGLTDKATIRSESIAAVAGGVTSFMEMPNTVPNAVTIDLLEEKYDIAARGSVANYSFYMGATNDNLEELLKVNRKTVCGVKIFMGSSTGNMLVDNQKALEGIFSKVNHLIAIHSESEKIIQRNLEHAKEVFGNKIPFAQHPVIRDEKACYTSTKKAVNLAEKFNTRLHILHISTKNELEFFSNAISIKKKRITAEVCVHHLWFTSDDYEKLGGQIKCNPAIKNKKHKKALWEALLDDRLDVIATDHAPHTWEEKQNPYLSCPSGLPLVQHSLLMLFDCYQEGHITLPKLVEKMCHAPAKCFKVKDRGYIREGYKADLVVIDPGKKTSVDTGSILYKCAWSPLRGEVFNASVSKTFVNGNLVYDKGIVNPNFVGERLMFA